MSTKTTMHLVRTASWLDRRQIPPALIVAALVFIVGGGISTIGRIRSDQAAAAVPTPQLPIVIIASPLPVVPPTAVPVQVAAVLPNTLRRAVVAYDAPAGNVLGAIEQGRAYRVLARFGADWLQADVTGSGVVWLRSADVLDLPADLVDIAPPQPQVVYVSVPAAPELAAPTPDHNDEQVTNQPPLGDFYTTPPNSSIEARQALIGSDPNALACNGSPLCGGLTNAQAQAALDRQRNIQDRLANERATR
jgi:hypothetical protein